MEWRVSLYERLNNGKRDYPGRHTFDVLYCLTRSEARTVKRNLSNDRRFIPVIEHYSTVYGVPTWVNAR